MNTIYLIGLIMAPVFILLLVAVFTYIPLKITDLCMKARLQKNLQDKSHMEKVFRIIENRKEKEKTRQQKIREATLNYLKDKCPNDNYSMEG